MVSETVLVTGGFGLVGSQTVRRLAADGHRVVATDLGTAAQRKAARSLPAGVEARWADLTDPDQVDRLVAETSPRVIVHLAAVIPPVIYGNPELARRVNVDATVALLRAAESLRHRVRFVQASSNAVHGARNPHRQRELLTAYTELRPSDLYGAHKAEAEQYVKFSRVEWVILRLAGVLSVEPGAMPFSIDALFFESALPTDGRMHSIDVRDAAAAFATATTADVAGEVLLIGGDECAQEALQFQHHAWPDMLAEMRAAAGWRRYPMQLVTPIARRFLKRRAAYRSAPGRYADPWGAIRTKLGEPRPDNVLIG
jgi:D-erythronate 2-dehydrogenase